VKLVIHANVLIKLYVPEVLSQKADSLFRDAENRRIDLIAPDLIYPEAGNILWKKQRLKELSRPDVEEITEAMLSLPLVVEPVKLLLPLAVDIAIGYNITVYDAAYVALATVYKTTLVTADKKLVDNLSKTILTNNIRWLGTYK
jgi:predicted nucleic acid-binding protein